MEITDFNTAKPIVNNIEKVEELQDLFTEPTPETVTIGDIQTLMSELNVAGAANNFDEAGDTTIIDTIQQQCKLFYDALKTDLTTKKGEFETALAGVGS